MQRKIAFTLVEILACFAIISVLTAVIISSVASGRDKARQATCLSNMRQIHAAVTLYRQDYDGSDSGNSVVHLGLPPFMGGLAMWGYIKDSDVMWCAKIEISLNLVED
ncbi:MAG: type II secretion system protein [Armatimonas sp.]